MMTISRRRFLEGAAVAPVLLGTPLAFAAGETLPNFTIAVADLPATLEPARELSNVGTRVTYSIFDTLIRRDFLGAPDGGDPCLVRLGLPQPEPARARCLRFRDRIRIGRKRQQRDIGRELARRRQESGVAQPQHAAPQRVPRSKGGDDRRQDRRIEQLDVEQQAERRRGGDRLVQRQQAWQQRPQGGEIAVCHAPGVSCNPVQIGIVQADQMAIAGQPQIGLDHLRACRRCCAKGFGRVLRREQGAAAMRDGERTGCAGVDGQHRQCRSLVGSKRSRSQSPNRLIDRVVRKIARPGKTAIHQAFSR